MKKSNKIKMVFVSDAIWPYNKGGKEKRLFDISNKLTKKGFDVHIYTMKWWTGKNIKKEKGITLHAISKLYPLYSGERRSIKEGILFGLSCFKLIKENWNVIDIDHMPFFPLLSTKLICLLKRKKMIATWHEVWEKNYWKEYLGNLGFIAYLIEKISFLTPNKIISVSKNTTDRLIEEGVPNKKIITIPDGIDFNHIQTIKPSLTKSDIIFAGRLLSHKNVNILIKSIAILKESKPNIKCLIIGDGPEKKQLEKMVINLDLEENISFLGFIENHDEIFSLIKSSKIFVLPSTREGFGIVVIEANACGIPVITTDYKDNASKDLIKKGENGCICKLNEINISKAIDKYLQKHPNNQVKQNCINSVKKYDWENIVKQIREVYQK